MCLPLIPIIAAAGSAIAGGAGVVAGGLAAGAGAIASAAIANPLIAGVAGGMLMSAFNKPGQIESPKFPNNPPVFTDSNPGSTMLNKQNKLRSLQLGLASTIKTSSGLANKPVDVTLPNNNSLKQKLGQ